MTTDNHEYNVPAKGTDDWGQLLNDNFEALDTGVPIVDAAGNRADYTPEMDAVFIARSTGVVHRGDGTDWVRLGAIPRQYQRTASGDGAQTTFTLDHVLYAVPECVHVTPTSADAAGDFWVSGRSGGDVTIEYVSAPPSGTDNLTWDLTVEA